MKGIICADLHLREDLPRCRKDEDWILTQENALKQISNICIQKKCDLYLVGDIFHRSSEHRMVYLIQNLARELEKNNLCVLYLCGNHDLKYHSSLNMNESAIGLLKGSRNCFLIKDYLETENVSASNFDEEDNKNAEIVFKHILCFPDVKSLPPNVDAMTAKEMLSEFPSARFIFLGDYHKSFCYEKNGRYVINPGCLLRQASDFKDYNPSVFYVDTDKNIVESFPIIDREELVDDSYILQEQEKEERIEMFANKLKDTKSMSLDYIENVNNAMIENKLSEELKKTINELISV